MAKAGDKQHGCLVAFAFSPYICTPPSGSVSNDIGFSNVQKITSAENLRSRASDEIVPFREFIIKDDTSALL